MEVVSPISTAKAMIVAILVSAILFRGASAVNLTVGGSSGWDLSTDLTQWSATASFIVNDSLVFRYTLAHNVIEVSKPNFYACQINSPIAVYYDGETVIPLTQSGTRYFVCGKPNHCLIGLKLRVRVLDDDDDDDDDGPTRQRRPRPPPPPKTSPPPKNRDSHTSHDHCDCACAPSPNSCGKIDLLALSSLLLRLITGFGALIMVVD